MPESCNPTYYELGAQGSAIRELFAYGLARKAQIGADKVFDFSIGNPSIPAPAQVKQAFIEALDTPAVELHGYTPAQGYVSTRTAIANSLNGRFGTQYDASMLYMTMGAAAALDASICALTEPGDEIVVIAPFFPEYRMWIENAGCTCVLSPACQDTMYPDLADLAGRIGPKTRAVIINSPNNPTGAVYPREVLEEIVEIARRHQLMIFSDEIYDRLCMDGVEHISIASLAPDLPCVTFSGLSKSHMIAGYRIGWMVLSGNKHAMKDYIEGLNMLSNMRLCSNVPAQSIVQTALGGYQSVNEYIRPGGRVYEQRNYIWKALNEIPGVSAVKPKAAFYIFPKLDRERFNITNDEQFALDLLHDKKLLITCGTGFNWGEPDHFRIVYLPRQEVLEEAIAKLSDFLSYYRQ